MRASSFTANLLTHNVLALSSMPAAFLQNSDCGAAAADACAAASGVEACSVGCIHTIHPDWLDKARCRYAAVESSKFPVVATFDVADHDRSQRAGRGTLVGDCVGGAAPAAGVDCVTRALAWARRELGAGPYPARTEP